MFCFTEEFFVSGDVDELAEYVAAQQTAPSSSSAVHDLGNCRLQGCHRLGCPNMPSCNGEARDCIEL